MKPTAFLLLAALLLIAIAQHRAAEYDEAYSLFLTAGNPRPPWPQGIFTPSTVRHFYTGHAGFAQIAENLKTGDVHPPLYFWCLEFWRRLFGPSWFAARLLSILISLATLAVIAELARAARIPVLAALALTVLSYGFAYTGIIARDIALAQFLNLLGFSLIFHAVRSNRQASALAGGLALGAASFTNYLAIFIACAVVAWLSLAPSRRRYLTPTALGLLPFLLLDAPFFLAQRASRTSQFAAFAPGHALALLAKDSGAALFGGLPLYAAPYGAAVTPALLLLFLAGLACILRHHPAHSLPLALAAIATPCGLILLGLVFHNTPIEIRYLAFSLPYFALLLAAALPRPLCVAFIAAEACAIAGLALAPSTMQPQALAAHEIAELAPPGALVLLPYGNDGVGIPGPFLATAPQNLQILLLRPGDIPNLAQHKTIYLAMVNADNSSRAATAQALAYFRMQKCFKETPATNLALKILNRCADQQR